MKPGQRSGAVTAAKRGMLIASAVLAVLAIGTLIARALVLPGASDLRPIELREVDDSGKGTEQSSPARDRRDDTRHGSRVPRADRKSPSEGTAGIVDRKGAGEADDDAADGGRERDDGNDDLAGGNDDGGSDDASNDGGSGAPSDGGGDSDDGATDDGGDAGGDDNEPGEGDGRDD